MAKFLLIFLFFYFLNPIGNIYNFCKMNKGNFCTCSPKSEKHNCCTVVKVYKDLNFDFKVIKIDIKKGFEEILNFFDLKIENFFIKDEISLKIHSPPIFIKISCLLI